MSSNAHRNSRSDTHGPTHMAVVARHYWPKPGAATVRLMALVAAARSRGLRVTVLTNRSETIAAPRVGPAGEWIIPIKGDNTTGVGVVRALRLLYFAVRAALILQKMRPAIVVSDPPPTSGFAALAWRPKTSVYYIADAWADMLEATTGTLSRLLAALVLPLERWVLRKSSLVIAVRQNLATTATSAGAKNVLVSPYGTDLTTFRPDGQVWNDPWQNALPYFLYAGNYGVIQGGTIFLEAAALLWKEGHEFGVVFMGYGSDQPTVDEFQKAHPAMFVSLPMMPPHVAAAANRGAVGALASMRPVDVAGQTRPAKALASAACGCPVVFAGVGIFAQEVSEARIGLACDWDALDVSRAMLELLTMKVSEPGKYQALRSSAAEHARTHYDMHSVAGSLLNEILATHAVSQHVAQ